MSDLYAELKDIRKPDGLVKVADRYGIGTDALSQIVFRRSAEVPYGTEAMLVLDVVVAEYAAVLALALENKARLVDAVATAVLDRVFTNGPQIVVWQDTGEVVVDKTIKWLNSGQRGSTTPVKFNGRFIQFITAGQMPEEQIVVDPMNIGTYQPLNHSVFAETSSKVTGIDFGKYVNDGKVINAMAEAALQLTTIVWAMYGSDFKLVIPDQKRGLQKSVDGGFDVLADDYPDAREEYFRLQKAGTLPKVTVPESMIGQDRNLPISKVSQGSATKSTGGTVSGGPNSQTLKQYLISNYSTSEISSICFDMGLDSDNFPRDTKTDFAQALVKFCSDSDRLVELKKLMLEVRPNLHGKL